MKNVVAGPSDHFLRHQLACPQCGNDVLEAVSDGDDTNFLCQNCWTCWHWELNCISEIRAETCPGCAHLAECLGRLRL